MKGLIDTLHKEITKREQKKTDARNFVAMTKRYTDLQELIDIQEKMRQGKGPAYERWANAHVN